MNLTSNNRKRSISPITFFLHNRMTKRYGMEYVDSKVKESIVFVIRRFIEIRPLVKLLFYETSVC